MAFPQRPFVLINQAELDRLRADLQGAGWKRDLYDAQRGNGFMPVGYGLRANAADWMHRTIVIPARGGHYHHFFCEDGDRLDIPPDQQLAPGPYRCPKCGRSYQGEKFDGAMRRLAHGWLARAALDLALVSALERDTAYARKAGEILLKYAAAYPGPHDTNTTGGMIFQSLDESMWVIPLAQAYDLVHASLSPEQCALIERFFADVAGGLQKCGTHGNWGSWHLSAVGVVGYAIQAPALIRWATEQFQAQIRDQLGDDGLWPESVHTYHYFPLMAFVAFAEAAFHAGVDLYHWEARPGKSLMRMFTAPLPYAYPDLRLPAINDGWFQAFLPPSMYEVACARDPRPEFAWVLANIYRPGAVPGGTVTEPNAPPRGGLYAFLFGRALPADVASPKFESINFPVLGICTLRSGHGAMLTFDYGPFLGHGQLDKMGITLFANGKLWAADYGTPGYGSSILPWYNATFSHNTMVVDGKSQAPTRENHAELWFRESGFEAVRSTTLQAFEGVTHTRTVIRLDDDFVVVDDLAAATSHVYDFYFHAEGEFSLQAPAPSSPADGAPSAQIKNLRRHVPRERIEACWRQPDARLNVTILPSTEATPLTALCPAESGSREVPLLIVRQTAAQARFLTLLRPSTAAAASEATMLPDGVAFQQGANRVELHIPSEGKPTLVHPPAP